MRLNFTFLTVLMIGIICGENTNNFAKALGRGLEHAKSGHETQKWDESKTKTLDVVSWTDDLTDDDTGRDIRISRSYEIDKHESGRVS